MGYTTSFYGELKFNRPLSQALADYINAFSRTRHVRRDPNDVKQIFPNWKELCWKGDLGLEGEYFVGPRIDVERSAFNSEEDVYEWRKRVERANGIKDDNEHPTGVPGLWCQWIVNEKGELCWSGGEKFYDYCEWLRYLIERFFQPEGYVLNGRILYTGERADDFGYIFVSDNQVERRSVSVNAYWRGLDLVVEMSEELKEDLDEILQKSDGISLEEALWMYIRWTVENPDDFREWIKEMRSK